MSAETPTPRDESRPPRRSTRDVAGIIGRTTAGTVIAVVAVAVVAGAAFLRPEPVTATAPSPIVVAPTPTAQQLVCPGGLLRLADAAGGSASTASPLGAAAVAWAGDTTVDTRTVGTTNAGTAGTSALAQIGRAAAASDPSAIPSASGLQSELLLGGTRGLATASCTTPESESWLVAGATTLGRTSLLVLTNPSAVEAIVDLEVFGPNGPITASGMRGIRLAPDEQRVIPLNGFAIDLAAPVVHVTSTGGRVSAAIEQTITRALTPGGVDWAGPQQPSGTVVIPGVHVTDSTALVPIDVSELDHTDTTPVVRLFAPPSGGTAEVTATISWIPEGSTLTAALAAHDQSGQAAQGDDQGSAAGDDDGPPQPSAPAPRSMDVTLTPGVATELPVTGMGAGDYTVVVSSPVPVVGAIRGSVIADAGLSDPRLAGGVDFAWFEPGAPLAAEAVTEVPGVPGGIPLSASLWLANPTGAAATVTVTPDGAAAQTVRLGAGATAQLSVPIGVVLRLAGTEGLSGAIVTSGPGLIAQSPLEPPSRAAGPVRVHL